ncbi:MAG: hypothetical protein KGI53_06170 [Nitrospirota bacterium]|nr:hypothetical protein [Nitrospirota bacterium]
MNVRAQGLTSLLASMAVAVIGSAVPSMIGPSMALAAEPHKIEVVIKDKSYKVTGASMPGELTSITIRNEDTIEHGFTSPLLFDVPVKMEGEGVYLKGKGVRAYHIRAGKSITLTFTKGSTKDVETQRIPFWCDMHPDMKGELFLVETKGEVGGG